MTGASGGVELTVHNPSAPDGGTVFLNQSLNRKLQRRKYVEYENLCWKCEGLIHLKHSSLINCSKRKRLVWTALVESKEASAHSFCLWGTDNELHFFKKKQSLFSGRKHIQTGICPQRLEFPIRFYYCLCGRRVSSSWSSNYSVLHVPIPLSLFWSWGTV